MITLRQIQFALAVSRHHHFKRAADECKVSQSALSLGIAEMEKNLGVALFERNNKQVVVTPIGVELLERAQRIYLDAQQLEERAKAGTGDLSFAMSIGFIPTIAPYLLPAALPALREQHPDFAINIHEDTSERLLDKVRNGTLDAALIALPYDTEGLDVLTFSEESFYAMVPKGHELADKKQLTNKQLQNAKMLLLGEGHCLKDQIVELCQFNTKHGHDFSREASLNTLIQMSVNNMGLTFVPEMALPYLTYLQDKVSFVPLAAKGPHRRFALATRPNYPRINELQTLSELFTQVIAENLKA
ncbi:LysR substrate-binding domain-containing protein [Suttonella sp. R2A3]|uniref:hydrogen peroxide-inducible genes activator n=1 Tax=Suttonella sp. R2A3 TaxID=2908648 RepID=UPI001F188E07|nr:hydrogen peroxide-inducible genes activator [Suttonella sp. R2A3]UJF23918.1 LysR substrate-binding domain-containing protein [Suttonella sp. R2A3]